jgi:Tat protein translocase TatB subunit
MEILVVAVVALIVFGPQRLPEITRTIGKTLNEFRRQAADIRSEFESGLQSMDPTADDEPGPAANRPVETPNAAELDNPSEDATTTTPSVVPALEPPEGSIVDDRPDADELGDDEADGPEDENEGGADEDGAGTGDGESEPR